MFLYSSVGRIFFCGIKCKRFFCYWFVFKGIVFRCGVIWKAACGISCCLFLMCYFSGPYSTPPLLAIISFASRFDQKTAFVSFPKWWCCYQLIFSKETSMKRKKRALCGYYQVFDTLLCLWSFPDSSLLTLPQAQRNKSTVQRCVTG